jgi:type II secretory ATPase GspE/PulE/Tfp pilus assembly ATPase PilB-like protein
MTSPESTLSLHAADARIIDHLLFEQLVSPNIIEIARKKSALTGVNLPRTLADAGFVTDSQVLNAVAATLSPADPYVSRGVPSSVPPEILVESRLVILAESQETVYVSSHKSLASVRLTLEPYLKGREICFLSLSQKRFYELDADNREQALWPTKAFAHARFLTSLFGCALREGLAGLDIVPLKNGYVIVRSRDEFGREYEVHEDDRAGYLRARDLLKDHCRMDCSVTDLSQDGAFDFLFAGELVLVRVKSRPGVSGEMLYITFERPSRH